MLFPAAAQPAERRAKLGRRRVRWYYMLLMVVCMAFVFWLALCALGHIRLSQMTNRRSSAIPRGWRCCSRRASALRWCTTAPRTAGSLLSPPERQRRHRAAARQAMAPIFALGAARLGGALTSPPRWPISPIAAAAAGAALTLYPIFGERIHGGVGHLVDSFGILVTVISMVTNLDRRAAGELGAVLFDIPQAPACCWP